MDHFARLQLPRCFAVDPETIEARYLALSRALHPDYHQQGSSSEQQASLTLSAGLNEAYSTLRDPFRRAEYLLGLLGGPSAADHKAMPADFLEEMLELRTEIEMLRESTPTDSPQRSEFEKVLLQRRAHFVQQLSVAFAEQEAKPEAKQALLKIRQLLNSAKYIQGLLRDLRA